MKNCDFQEKHFQISDPIESDFESIATCDMRVGGCISRCVAILQQDES